MTDNERARLYDIALRTRNFEISLYWQRFNYFLVLNTAIAIGFFTAAPSGYRLVLALLGAFSSALWLRVCAGSKFWQSRWEQRLREIEKSEFPKADFFAASWPTITADVRSSLDFSEHGGVRAFFDRLVLRKPSVSFEMMKLATGFTIVWFGVALFELFVFLSALEYLDLDRVTPPSVRLGAEMNAIIFVPVLLALQFAAFGWRISREIAIGDEGRKSWLPLPDYINCSCNAFSYCKLCSLAGSLWCVRLGLKRILGGRGCADRVSSYLHGGPLSALLAKRPHNL